MQIIKPNLTYYHCTKCQYLKFTNDPKHDDVSSCPKCSSNLLVEEFNADSITNWEEMRKMHKRILDIVMGIHKLHNHTSDQYIIMGWGGEKIDPSSVKPITIEAIE